MEGTQALSILFHLEGTQALSILYHLEGTQALSILFHLEGTQALSILFHLEGLLFEWSPKAIIEWFDSAILFSKTPFNLFMGGVDKNEHSFEDSVVLFKLEIDIYPSILTMILQ